jgi:hypothetical protein
VFVVSLPSLLHRTTWAKVTQIHHFTRLRRRTTGCFHRLPRRSARFLSLNFPCRRVFITSGHASSLPSTTTTTTSLPQLPYEISPSPLFLLSNTVRQNNHISTASCRSSPTLVALPLLLALSLSSLAFPALKFSLAASRTDGSL